MRKGRIEKWQPINWFGQERMFGYVYGCKSQETGEQFIEDGEDFITSPIEKFDSIMGQLVIHTKSGSVYELGEPAAVTETPQQIFKRMSDEIEAEKNGVN